MSTTVQTDIRAHQCSSSDGEQTGVDDHAVEVDKEACAYLHVEPVVDPNGAFDPWLVLEKNFIFGWALAGRRERSSIFSDADAGLVSCLCIKHEWVRSHMCLSNSRNGPHANHSLFPKLYQTTTRHFSGIVEPIARMLATLSRRSQIRGEGMVELPTEHFLFFRGRRHSRNQLG